MGDVSTASNNKLKDYIAYAFICLPAIIHFFVINHFALNLPYYDDFTAILAFLNKYKTSGATDKFLLLFSYHNEHRIFLARFVSLMYYSVFGNINFRGLIFIGNAQLLFILTISIHFIKKALPNHWKLTAFLFSLFIFDLNNWNNADWAMASLQNQSTLFLALASLYFYSLDKKWHLLLAILIQFICTFSSGNGTIASLCIMLYTILSKEKSKMICGIGAFIIFAPMYFIHFKPLSHSVGIHNFILALFQLTSGHFYIGRRNYNIYIMEGISAVYFIALLYLFPIRKKLQIRKEYLPFVSILAFVLCTIALLCRNRGIEIIGGIPPSRYLIYCNYLTGILFLFFMIKFQQKKFTNIITITFAIIMVFCYARNFKVSYYRTNTWREYVLRNVPNPWGPPEIEEEAAIAKESCRLNIYCIEPEKKKLK